MFLFTYLPVVLADSFILVSVLVAVSNFNHNFSRLKVFNINLVLVTIVKNCSRQFHLNGLLYIGLKII